MQEGKHRRQSLTSRTSRGPSRDISPIEEHKLKDGELDEYIDKTYQIASKKLKAAIEC